MSRIVAVILTVLLVSSVASAEAASRTKTRLRVLGVHLVGSRPGVGYHVDVHARLRACGRIGDLYVHVRETESPYGRDHPVYRQNRRKGTFDQPHRCSTHSIKWRLGDEFFGIGRYSVLISVRTRHRGWSPVRRRHFDTAD